MKRLMAIDYGEKRIGVALSDFLKITARPYLTLPNDESTFFLIQDIVDEENVEKIILGLPLNLKSEDTKKTKEVRCFKLMLDNILTIPIEFYNETYSTCDAREILSMKKMTWKEEKKKIDQIAACVILKNYLGSR